MVSAIAVFRTARDGRSRGKSIAKTTPATAPAMIEAFTKNTYGNIQASLKNANGAKPGWFAIAIAKKLQVSSDGRNKSSATAIARNASRSSVTVRRPAPAR